MLFKQLLEVKPYEKVLEIGTGSGYQAAVLSLLDADVFTIERQKKLYNKTKNFCLKLATDVNLYLVMVIKDYQILHLSIKLLGHVELRSEELLTQLGGRMAVPIGDEKSKNASYKKKSSQDYDISTHGILFVPMLDDKTVFNFVYNWCYLNN